MRKLLPLLLALIGLGAGAGAGLALRPAKAPEAADHAAVPGAGAHPAAAEDAAAAPGHAAESVADEGHAAEAGEGHAPAEGPPLHDYVKLNNQFVIPVVEGGQVAALVVLALSLEVTVGGSEGVYAREPKLRDAFLQVLFNHANAGGFRGAFTESGNMLVLRAALREAAIKTLGPQVTDVLIIDLVRQDT